MSGKSRWFSLGWVLFAAFFFFSCGKGGEGGVVPPESAASRKAETAPLPLFLLPPQENPRSGLAFLVALRAGTAPPGRFVEWRALDVDYFFARQGGRQWVLAPGEEAALPLPGEALLALSTHPVSVPGIQGKAVYCAKTVVNVSSPQGGKAPPPSPIAGAKAGFPLEIVPLADPGTLRPGDDCPLRVVFQGDSLVGAEVRIEGECRGWGRPLLPRTDEEGGVCFRLEGPGAWLAVVRRSGLSEEGERTAWISSLYFRVEGGER